MKNPDLIIQIRFPSTDPDFNRVLEAVRQYKNSNQAGKDGLRLLAGIQPVGAPPPNANSDVIAYLDSLDEKLDRISGKLERLQAMGISPTTAIKASSKKHNPELDAEVLRRFMEDQD